jgi:hypothetical protein
VIDPSRALKFETEQAAYFTLLRQVRRPTWTALKMFGYLAIPAASADIDGTPRVNSLFSETERVQENISRQACPELR